MSPLGVCLPPPGRLKRGWGGVVVNPPIGGTGLPGPEIGG